jgi:hypothetical protein
MVNYLKKLIKFNNMREDILQALSELIKEKTELKAEKIKLGVIDDLNKLVNQIKNINKQLIKDSKDYIKQDKIVQKLYQKRLKIEEQLNKIKQEEEKEVRTWKVDADVMEESKNDSRNLRIKIEKKLDVVKKQAKALGVDIPLDKYENAINESLEATRKAIDADPLPF